jgi:hypothetical protein
MSWLLWIPYFFIPPILIIFGGAQIVWARFFNFPWAVIQFGRGNLKFRGVILCAITPILWASLFIFVLFIGPHLFPTFFAQLFGHPATKMGTGLGLFWLLIGTFSTGASKERAEEREKVLQVFGRQKQSAPTKHMPPKLQSNLRLVEELITGLERAVEMLGYKFAGDYLAKTRSADEATSLTKTMKEVATYKNGEVNDINRAVSISSALACLLWGELGKAINELGLNVDVVAYLKAKKGEEYANEMAEIFVRALSELSPENMKSSSLEIKNTIAIENPFPNGLGSHRTGGQSEFDADFYDPKPSKAKVRDLMIIFGPPGPDEIKNQVVEKARKTEERQDKVWVGLVHAIVSSMRENEKEHGNTNSFDRLLSDLLKMQVTVSDPFLTYYFEKDTYSPAIQIEFNKIMVARGQEENLNEAIIQSKGVLGDAFGYLFKTDWARVILSYES